MANLKPDRDSRGRGGGRGAGRGLAGGRGLSSLPFKRVKSRSWSGPLALVRRVALGRAVPWGLRVLGHRCAPSPLPWEVPQAHEQPGCCLWDPQCQEALPAQPLSCPLHGFSCQEGHTSCPEPET